MAENKTPPSADEQQARIDAERAAIVSRQARLDTIMLGAFDAGEDVDQFVTEQAQLRARWAALDALELKLAPRRQAEEKAELLVEYEAYTKVASTNYATIALLDKQDEKHRAAIAANAKQRAEHKSIAQVAFGKRLNLLARIRALGGLRDELRAIDKQYKVPGYFG